MIFGVAQPLCGSNSLKVFARTGYKLPDADDEIEEEIFRLCRNCRNSGPPWPFLPWQLDVRPYLTFLLGTIERPLHGLRLIVDCGNGAASALAPDLFRAAGAEVVAIFNQPDGRNINLNCGALHVEALREKVIETGADAEIAFDSVPTAQCSSRRRDASSTAMPSC